MAVRAYDTDFLQLCDNNIKATLILSQLYYWGQKMGFKDFYKIDKELSEETGIPYGTFRRIKAYLVEKGLIKVKRTGIPGRTTYDLSNFYDLIKEKVEKVKENIKEGALEITKATKQAFKRAQEFKESLFAKKKGFDFFGEECDDLSDLTDEELEQRHLEAIAKKYGMVPETDEESDK